MVRYEPWVSQDPQKIRTAKRPIEPTNMDLLPPDMTDSLLTTMIKLMIAPRMGQLWFLLLHTPAWLALIWQTVIEHHLGSTSWILFGVSSIMICRRLRDFGFSALFYLIYPICLLGGVQHVYHDGGGLFSAQGLKLGFLFCLPFMVILYLMPGHRRYEEDEDD